MKDGINIKGFWWLPDKAENEFPGTLTYLPGNHISLNIDGDFNISEKSGGINPQEFISPSLIQGFESETGRQITLYDCHQTGSSFRISGIHSSKFSCLTAFVGGKFDKPEDLLFRTISVRFSNLDQWANRRPFDHQIDKQNFNNQKIQYTNPESILSSTENFDLNIIFGGPQVNGFGNSNKMSISYETWIEIESKEEFHITKYQSIIRVIQNFLSLGMGNPTYPIKIYGMSDHKSEIDGEDIEFPIDIYYPVAWWPDKFEEYHAPFMPFSLPVIEDKFEMYLQKWLKMYDLIEPTLNLYFAGMYNPENYYEMRFLSIVQSLETYHRRVFGGNYQERDDYLKSIYPAFVEAIPSELKSDFKDSIKGRMVYLNEYSLRRRIRELIKHIEDNLDGIYFDFINSNQTRDQFISDVVDTRNYWTHYSENLTDSTPQSGDERLSLITKLQLLLELCFMIDLGFTPEVIKTQIRRSHNFNILRNIS